jgi:hypothetical protein
MEDKRKHCRVDAKMPIGSRLLPKEEAAYAQSRLGGREGGMREFPLPPEQADPRLNEWLKMLNAKLDTLLALHASDKKDALEMKMRPVNISAGGIMFPSDAHYKPGDKIEIHMELPMKKPLPLVVIAEEHQNFLDVIRVVFVSFTGGAHYMIATEFGRRVIPPSQRPTFEETERIMGRKK